MPWLTKSNTTPPPHPGTAGLNSRLGGFGGFAAAAGSLRLLPLLLTCWAFQAKAQPPTTFTYTPTEIYEGETLTFVLTTDADNLGYSTYDATFRSTSATHGTDFTVTSVGADTTAGKRNSGDLVYASPLPPADLECTTSYPCYDYYPTVEADDTYDIIITATTDSTSENDETITIYWMDDNLKLIGTIEITIKDGQRPGVTVSESTLALTEGGAVKAYTVKPATDPGTGTTVVVTPTSADTTAVTVSPASHSFTGGSSGTWKTAKTFTVTAIEDGDTTGETVNITHGVTNYGTVTSAPMVVVTVTDAGKGVLVSRSALSVKENGGEGKYTLRLKSQPASGTVTLSVTSDDTAKATVSPASLAFNTTNWSSLQTVTVTGVADGSATVSHAVASADDTTNYPTSLTIPGVAVTVADLPEVSIEPKTNTNPVTEGTAAVFTVTRAGGVGGTTNPVTVTLRVADAPNSDFVAPANEGDKTVDIPAGTATVDFSVDTETDSTDEPDGPVTVTVQPDPGYTISSAMGSATRTVNDDDTSGGGGGGNGGGTTPPPPPTVSISGGSAVTEGEAAVFTLSHSGRVMSALTVLLAVSENEAEGQDFVTPANEGNRRVVIPAGATTTTYRVSTNDDAVDEPDGAVTVALRDSTAYTTGAAATVTVVVTDDDESSPDMPVVSITAGDSVTEGMPAVFTLTATPAPAAGTSITVNLAVAESGSFVASSHTGSRSVTIGTEGTASFTVATEDDNAYEPAGGSITATVEGGTGYLPHADDATAVVTVADNDKVASANAMALQGWHSRMGRTVSQQVVDALQHRFSAPPTPSGLHLTMAGEELNGSSATPLVENQQVLSKALGFETVTAQQLVQGSSFSFSPEGGSANFAFWGQGALTSFSGQQNNVSFDGDVTTALLGAEWNAKRWQAGAALSHSWGSGAYEHQSNDDPVGDGDLSTTLTAVFPYARYALTPRLGVWATAGHGWGELSLQSYGDDREYSPDTTMTMAALGLDGILLDGGADGFSLTTTADFLTLQTSSEAVDGLASSQGNVSRFRLGVEASRPVSLANGSSLLPSMEIGIRQDSGDVETGFGMELGAGLSWNHPQQGISADLKGRTLLSHAEEDFQEQGLALSFNWDPNPTDRGPSLSLSHSLGAATAGGLDALLNPTAIQVLNADPQRNGQHRFEATLAYGLPVFNNRLTMTPGIGLALASDTTFYRLLWALRPYADQPGHTAQDWHLSLEAERQETSTPDTPVEHSVGLNFSLAGGPADVVKASVLGAALVTVLSFLF